MTPFSQPEAASIRAALTAAAALLVPITDTPRLDAELLMAHVLGIPRETMLLSYPDGAVPVAFASLLSRRVEDREPVAYIRRAREFWSLDLAVGPGVLIPRPDSETLIEAAIGHFACAATSPASILDLGTGSGALLLAALTRWPVAHGLGVDRSAEALGWARINAARHTPGRAAFILADWAAPIDARFDLVLCNPPYVESGAKLPPDVARHEPPEALFAGADGLDCHRALAPTLPRLLAPGGVACVEIGASEAGSASRLFEAERMSVEIHPDLSGRDRCLMLRRRA